MCAAEWPLLSWLEERDIWDAASGTYRGEPRERTLTLLPWHSMRHRFARIAIDTYRADPAS
jgi:hypothetical protein